MVVRRCRKKWMMNEGLDGIDKRWSEVNEEFGEGVATVWVDGFDFDGGRFIEGVVVRVEEEKRMCCGTVEKGFFGREKRGSWLLSGSRVSRERIVWSDE